MQVSPLQILKSLFTLSLFVIYNMSYFNTVRVLPNCLSEYTTSVNRQMAAAICACGRSPTWMSTASGDAKLIKTIRLHSKPVIVSTQNINKIWPLHTQFQSCIQLDKITGDISLNWLFPPCLIAWRYKLGQLISRKTRFWIIILLWLHYADMKMYYCY